MVLQGRYVAPVGRLIGLDALPLAQRHGRMNNSTKKWIEKLFGSFAREAVRIGFTIYAIRLFVNHAPKTPAECMSELFGVKTNGTQVFALIVLLTAGLGVALAMKFIEKKFGAKAA